uniref:Calcium uniporter protein C-terminal domain-containing protein n=1 Tax=Aplanochytrium stocchinoi TaxID=215587 RepID=A0A7S3LLC3_9STRA|mmetsp:Transcript_818/g.1119  ORF Transcript_818/g.1119 Transcript_818/m.1119 type:complete len:351 (+) Transcript_818:292-1344(+)
MNMRSISPGFLLDEVDFNRCKIMPIATYVHGFRQFSDSNNTQENGKLISVNATIFYSDYMRESGLLEFTIPLNDPGSNLKSPGSDSSDTDKNSIVEENVNLNVAVPTWWTTRKLCSYLSKEVVYSQEIVNSVVILNNYGEQLSNGISIGELLKHPPCSISNNDNDDCNLFNLQMNTNERTLTFSIKLIGDPSCASESLLQCRTLIDQDGCRFKLLENLRQQDIHNISTELALLQGIKDDLDNRAILRTRIRGWLIGFYLVGQYCALAYGVWGVYSWDVMEPICYFLTTSVNLWGLIYFVRFKKENRYDTLWEQITSRQKQKFYKTYAFDESRYKYLKKLVHGHTKDNAFK